MVVWKAAGRGTNPAPAAYAVTIQRSVPMQIDVVTLQPIVALVAGILILVMPRLLNYIVAIYLIFIGVAGLIGKF